MNIANKMEQEVRLRENLADWMIGHGIVLSDRERSNPYVGVRIAEVRWQGRDYRIFWVDGMACRIEKA